MRRVMYLFLPSWPIDRLRRLGSLPSLSSGTSADEAPFATVITTGIATGITTGIAAGIATGIAARGRRLLAAVNPAASAAGLAPGMPLADALSFLPGLATSVAEPAADAAALTRLAEWCGRYSPWTAPDHQPGGAPGDSGGVKIEITGCAHLWGGEAKLAADLARRLARQGIGHRIAIAGGVGAAWALARFAAGAGQPALPGPDEEQGALASLPVEALRLDPVTVAGLRRVGLRRIDELSAMPRDALARRFGEQVARRLDQALGQLPEPLSPLGEAPVWRVRLSFAEPIADPADLIRAAEQLVDDLVVRLAREGMGARRLDLAFHRVDGRVEHIRLGTARPSRDPKHLAGLVTAPIETIDPGLGVEDMILAVFAVEKLPAEQTGFIGASDTASGGIAPLLDRLGARLGFAALSHIEPCESHIPERASICVAVGASARPPHPPHRFAMGPLPLPPEGRRGQAGATSSPSPPPGAERVGVRWGNSHKPPRPVRLFAPPEPISASWLLPDDPPFLFTWRRRPHRVHRADGPERIAEEWWTDDGSMATDAIRDYYRVEDSEGRRFWLFRIGLPGDPPPRWFVHGLFA